MLVPTDNVTTRSEVDTTRAGWLGKPCGLERYRLPGSVGTTRTGAVAIGTDFGTDRHWRARPVARCRPLIGSHFQFEFKTNRLKWKTTCFTIWVKKSKKSNSAPPHHLINTPPLIWAQVTFIQIHFHSLDTHTMFSSSSSGMEDQIVMAFSGVME
jgi:hypothetical protein